MKSSKKKEVKDIEKRIDEAKQSMYLDLMTHRLL